MGFLDNFGSGEGQSISMFDNITGTNTVHGALWGRSYEDKYKQLGNQISGIHGKSQASLYRSLAAIKRGYGGAQDALNQGGAVATRALLDREQQSLAGAKQSSISRGLYDTTQFDAASRGIGADTNNALSSLNAQLAQLGSNIRISEGQDIAGVYGNMAASQDNFANLMLQLGLNTEYGEQGGVAGLASGIVGSIFG